VANGAHSAAAEDAYGARPRSIGNDRLTRKERRELKEVTRRLSRSQVYSRRPKTLGDCERRVTGPCGWVSCRHHLFLEVDDETGAIKLNFPGREIDEIGETCSLRAAQRGGHTLDATGALLNLTLERARQVERSALYNIRRKLKAGDDYPAAFKEMVAGLVAQVVAQEEDR
jgi:hypothetical protein